MRIILLLVGIVALVLGLLWVGQGTGYVTQLPSPMINDMNWAYRGIALAVAGLVVILISRRM